MSAKVRAAISQSLRTPRARRAGSLRPLVPAGAVVPSVATYPSSVGCAQPTPQRGARVNESGAPADRLVVDELHRCRKPDLPDPGPDRLASDRVRPVRDG